MYMKLHEIIKHDKFPENYLNPQEEVDWVKRTYLSKAKVVAQVKSNISLLHTVNEYNEDMYILEKESEPLAILQTQDVNIHNTQYTFIKLVYVLKKYRNTNAIKYLIYAIAETIPNKVAIDDAVYAGGQRIVDFFAKTGLVKLSVLDKETGYITPFDNIPNDPNKAIIVTTGKHGFGEQYLPESFMPYVWHPIEEYLGTL